MNVYVASLSICFGRSLASSFAIINPEKIVVKIIEQKVNIFANPGRPNFILVGYPLVGFPAG